MKTIKKALIIIGLITGMILIPTISSQINETTTIEFIDIHGDLGGVTVDITNTGEITANDLIVSITISGGFFNTIDLTKECTGCGEGGSTLEPGEVKSKGTLGAGPLFGIGPIQITASAEASNADEIFLEASGFIIGVFILL
jgi:hypothetical protein